MLGNSHECVRWTRPELVRRRHSFVLPVHRPIRTYSSLLFLLLSLLLPELQGLGETTI